MTRLRELRESYGLRERWNRWANVVERFARRDRGRRSISAEEYRRMHQELIHASRNAARGGGEPERFWGERILLLAQPWMSIDLLERADAAALASLQACCHDLAADMGCRRRPSLVKPLLRISLLLVAGAVVGLGWPHFGVLLDWGWLLWRPVRLALQEISFAHKLVIGAVGAMTLASLLFWRTRSGR